MDVLYKLTFRSILGEITLLATERGLCFVKLPGDKSGHTNRFIDRYFPKAVVKQGGKVNQEASRQLRAYLRGKLRKFTVKTDLRSSPFYRATLNRVKAKTKTYGEIAAQMGRARASRAVGGANASNPLPIVIPCHRVLARSGLGGYGGASRRGLKLKSRLLKLERAKLPAGA